MRRLTKVRSAFRVIKSAAIKFVAGLINGTIQIGIANGRFFYENHSQNQDIKINIPLSSVPAQPALCNA